jgi:hypothetical protein
MGNKKLSDVEYLLQQSHRYSNYVTGLCPFHPDRSPSLMVYEDGWFICLACGVKGNLDYLYSKLKGTNASMPIQEKTAWRPPTLKPDPEWLEDYVTLAHENLLQFEQPMGYLKDRGIDGRVEACRLGWSNGWYVVPVYDSHGTLKSVVLRASPHVAKATGVRFHNPPGHANMLYCPDWRLFEKSRTLAVVFGLFDALTLSDMRYAVVTPTNGKMGIQSTWFDSIRKKIVIIPDLGEEDQARKLAAKLGWRGSVLQLPYPDGCKDPNDYLQKNRRNELECILTGVLG